MNKIYKNKLTNEFEMVTILTDFFRNINYNIHLEVPNSGQSVDIVAEKNDKMTLVEAKIKNWKRAVDQCQAHEQIADYIYIAIASVTVSDSLIKIAKEKGYGVIHCNPYSYKCLIVLEATKNINMWHPQREIFMNHINGV